MIFESLLCVSGGPLVDGPNCRFRGPGHSVHGPGIRDHETRVLSGLTCNYAEPPIGIEPMTYALRGGLQSSTAVHQ
jgi:hypothetical protein